MPRSVTVQMPDGTSQTYEGVPDGVSDAEVQKRATTDFGVEKVGGTMAGLGKAAYAGAASGVKSIPRTMEKAENVLPPTQQMLLRALRGVTPKSQEGGALQQDAPDLVKSLDSDYAPQNTPERYVASIAESVIGGLPLGGWTPGGAVVNGASGLLGQYARESKMGGVGETVLPMLPALAASLAHIISPRTAVKEARTAVDKLAPGTMDQGRIIGAKSAEKGLPLLPGQAVPPSPGQTQTTLETLTEKVRQTPQGVGLQQFLHSQDDALSGVKNARDSATKPLYAAGGRTRPAPNDPNVQATQLELALMQARKSIPAGGEGERAIKDITTRADKNLIPSAPGAPVPASHSALNTLSRELREKAQTIGANTVEGAMYTEASVKLKRLAEQSPDVATANRLYAEYSEMLKAGGRARAGMAHANPVTTADAADTAPVIGSAMAAAASPSNPANVGWALMRPLTNLTQRSANRQLSKALGDPTFQKLDDLLNRSKTRDVMLEVLRGYQQNQIQGKE